MNAQVYVLNVMKNALIVNPKAFAVTVVYAQIVLVAKVISALVAKHA